ncbi:MAG: zinc ribbon domain-containing protein [Verrucomicrobiota bacterium]|jgi:hypothetical protein
MSLIKCKECGEQISSKAIACPKCGAPQSVNNPTPSNAGKIILYTVLIIIAPLLGFQIYKLQERSEQKREKVRQEKWDAWAHPNNADSSPQHSPEPLSISVQALYDEAKFNASRTTSKYQGRRWTFTGKVIQINGGVVFLQDREAITGRIATVTCGFGENPSAVNSLNMQQNTTISGEILMLTDVELTGEFVVTLKNCQIE